MRYDAEQTCTSLSSVEEASIRRYEIAQSLGLQNLTLSTPAGRGRKNCNLTTEHQAHSNDLLCTKLFPSQKGERGYHHHIQHPM
jgi:hypothetical protein